MELINLIFEGHESVGKYSVTTRELLMSNSRVIYPYVIFIEARYRRKHFSSEACEMYLCLRGILMDSLMYLLSGHAARCLNHVLPRNILHLLRTCRGLAESRNLGLMNCLNSSWRSVVGHVKLSALSG